jgi:phage protein D
MPNTVVRLYSARPTVRVDGAQNDRIDAAMCEMRLREQVGGLSSAELRFFDSVAKSDGTAAFAFADGKVLKLGAEVRLYAGDAATPQEIFRGNVSALETEAGMDAPPSFAVLAEDALQKARRSRRSASYVDKSPADVVRAVAGRLGIQVTVNDGLDAPVCTWMQMNETDLSFLRRVLGAIDADMQMVGDSLQAGPRARDDRGQIDLTHGANLRQVRITADLADVATQVRVAGWDPRQGKPVSSVAKTGTLGPGSGPAGKDLASRALGASCQELVGHHGEMTQSEADILARSVFAARARRFVRATGTTDGNPQLRVGTKLRFLGVNALLATTVTVVEATHRFDLADGYVTDFVGEGAFMGVPN